MPPGGMSAALAATAVGTWWIPRSFSAAYPGARCTGEVLTVRLVAGDNGALHRALQAADPGQVIVASSSGTGDAGHWGELMTRAAITRRLGGLVIDASIRDRRELRELGFPVFFRSTCPRKAVKTEGGAVGDPISIGGVEIATGDHVVADEDGVVVIPRSLLAAVTAETEAIAAREAETLHALASGRASVE
jgi:4-hydroxy-4-methyl-2-oxoglutarate aldolase